MVSEGNSLTVHIDNYLVEQDRIEDLARQAERTEEMSRGIPPRFYPSNMGKCTRYIVYYMLGYPRPPVEPVTLRKFKNGDSMHERYQTWFEDMGILVAKEYEFQDEDLRVSGRIDAIIDISHIYKVCGQTQAVVELKSANAKSFYFMAKRHEPDPMYEAQLQLYLRLMKMPVGVILVENKNTQELMEFWVTHDEKLSDSLIEKIKLVNYCVDTNQIPPRDYDRSSYQCQYCDFSEICYSTSA